MAETTTTPWFPGDVKPVRNGIYERDMSFLSYAAGKWSYWNGAEWCGWGGTPELAFSNFSDGIVSRIQDAPWRGLTRCVDRSRADK